MSRPGTANVDQVNFDCSAKVAQRMETKKLDGDVLANRLSLAEAKGQRFLASLLGPQPADTADNATKVQNEDEDLKEDYGHDR